MNELKVKDGILFIDGVEVQLKAGESNENLLYGEIGDDKVFTYNGEFYKGKNWGTTEPIGTIAKEDFLELKKKSSR